MDNWNPEKYLRFEKERTQPVIDLVNRIISNTSVHDIIDIGCGPGNSTNILHENFKNATILGIDSSKDMILKAQKTYKDIDFCMYDASNDLDKLNKKFDIVFSNACIHWIPNHSELLKNMMSLLKDGGTLAVQIPMQAMAPIHQIINEVRQRVNWKDTFDISPLFHSLTQSEYFDILSKIASDFSIWKTVYYHTLNDHQSILEWYRETGLKPYLNLLGDNDKILFENDIYDEVTKAYKKQENGQIMFEFHRLFFVAIK